MSPFPIHPPLTSDQASEKSLERLPGKNVNGQTDRQTDGHTTFSDSSSTAAWPKGHSLNFSLTHLYKLSSDWQTFQLNKPQSAQ